MSYRYARFIRSCALLLALVVVVGCSQQSSTTPTAQVVPTVSSVFGIQPTIEPKPTRDTTSGDSADLLPTVDATVIAQATNAALGEDQLKEVIVYDDTLNTSWSLDNSFQVNMDLKNIKYTHKGRYAIRVQPKRTTGTLYFTLNRSAEPLRRNRVQAVRFYLSGGGGAIGNEAIAVAVIGSNVRSYWVKNDDSVQLEGRVTDDQPVFSETRLSFLNINTAIPPKTYTEVTVWLDSLLYDPLYTYVTGFYLKTDKDSAPAFYVDQVSVLLLPDSR
ncbi:MAG: hypothetical protein HGA19_04710 [Oscillochloris sp.]|nr:hypothetical protein [Oscillochloris sp.]